MSVVNSASRGESGVINSAADAIRVVAIVPPVVAVEIACDECSPGNQASARPLMRVPLDPRRNVGVHVYERRARAVHDLSGCGNQVDELVTHVARLETSLQSHQVEPRVDGREEALDGCSWFYIALITPLVSR